MEKRWQILGITSVGVFMASLDMFIVNIAFPDIAADFAGTSLSELSWVLNAYAIIFAALLVPAGRLADRIGRKRVFLTGLALFGAASAACALADSVAALVAARVFQAAGGAMMIPASLWPDPARVPARGAHQGRGASGLRSVASPGRSGLRSAASSWTPRAGG